MSNHISALDVLLVPWSVYTKHPHETLMEVAKEELFRNPLLGWFLRKIHSFPIKRGGAGFSAIRTIEDYIRRHKVVLYPEGTRSRDGKLGTGNRMVGKIIRDTKPVVIPVAVSGTDKVIPVGKVLPQWGSPVRVTFGAPLDLSEEYAVGNSKESSIRIVERVMGAISELLEEGGARDLPAAERASR